MMVVRSLASMVHNLRSEAKQPLRQKIASLVIKGSKGIKSDSNLVELLREEANVLAVKFDTPMGKNFLKDKVGVITVGLDTKLTPELEKEGLLRELLRELQDARKKHGLMVGQKAKLAYKTNDTSLANLIEDNQKGIISSSNFLEIKKVTTRGEPIMGGRLEVKITT